jgi:bacterioferritin
MEAEQQGATLYRELIAHAETVRDYVTRDLAREILSDEEKHIDFIETQFEMIARMGLQNYVQLQSEAAEE